MSRRIPPKVARKVGAKVHNVSKWAFWFVLSWIALAAWGVYSSLHMYMNKEATLIGRAVDCVNRPSPMALKCDPWVDGIACTEGSRGWLRDWHQPIDYACARFEPDRVFRFPVNRETETLEIAEVSG